MKNENFKNFPYKKALVTGGAGFIGSHIVEKLVYLGVNTISIDNYFAGKKENLSHLSGYKNFREIECDILNFDLLESIFKEGIDVVFHQAASKKTICLNNPRLDLDINAKGVFNLLELGCKYKVKKFVHASTGSVYGEAQYYPQDEEHPLIPTSYYGISKLAGEKYVKVFNHLYGLDTTSLRYFHVYGPRQESSDVGGVVSIFLRRILSNQPLVIYGDGTQQRSFTFVHDIVKANLLAAITPETKGDVFNCASGIKISINELAHTISKILGKKEPEIHYQDWTPGDIKVFDINNKKIVSTLNMDFLTDFEKGLEETVKWAINYFTSDST